MTFEEAYAARWRRDAIAEGHRKRLPVASYENMFKLKKPEAYAAIIAAMGDKWVSINQIHAITKYSNQLIQDRLRWLLSNGKVEKVGYLWRVK